MDKSGENTAEEVLQKAYTSSQRAMMIQVPDTFHCHFSIVFTESKGMDEYYFHRTQSLIQKLAYTKSITDIFMRKEAHNALAIVFSEIELIEKKICNINELLENNKRQKKLNDYYQRKKKIDVSSFTRLLCKTNL